MQDVLSPYAGIHAGADLSIFLGLTAAQNLFCVLGRLEKSWYDLGFVGSDYRCLGLEVWEVVGEHTCPAIACPPSPFGGLSR